MADRKPTITILQPTVFPDNRRVQMEMVVENLPGDSFAAVNLFMPDISGGPPRPDPNAPSPYPNVELTILDSQRREVASLFIVEHKERETALTMHLPAPDPNEQYTARAEMTYQNETLQVVEAPFRLNPVD
jgi:hypothetical protein